MTVDGTLAATTLTGDGSGITGVSASSIKSDDITAGDAAVTISTSTGAINLTPADGSAVVLDGSVNVDGGAVTGATTITASGAVTVGSTVSYTHLRAHETDSYLVCRLLLEKKKNSMQSSA